MTQLITGAVLLGAGLAIQPGVTAETLGLLVVASLLIVLGHRLGR